MYCKMIGKTHQNFVHALIYDAEKKLNSESADDIVSFESRD
jgi:hypothetical protein